MPRNPKSRCNLTWHQRFGTSNEGNLPTYKTASNPCGVNISLLTYPGITEADFRYMHKNCPYSTTASGFNYVRDTNPASDTYFKMLELDSGDFSTHTVTSGIMIRETRGSRYGWLCVDDDCTYYINTGNRYFLF